jgi:hypothetical protein
VRVYSVCSELTVLRYFSLLTCAGSIGFTRRGGATRLTHSSISDMLQEFPDSIPGMLLQQELQSRTGEVCKILITE